jgi:hypothetical protein
MLPGLDGAWLEGRAHPIALLVGFAIIAILALLVASAALFNGQRHGRRNSIDDEELFTTTPLPMPKEELARMRREARHHPFSVVTLPRWVQVGSILAALMITYAVAQRVEPAGRRKGTSDSVRSALRVGAADRTRDDPNDSPEDLDLSPDSAPAFAFRVRDWVASNGGCAGLLEVTKGEPRSWNLTARVHDGQGQLMDTAHTRVASLNEGDVVEFKFPKVDCDRIGAWEVRGAPRQP